VEAKQFEHARTFAQAIDEVYEQTDEYVAVFATYKDAQGVQQAIDEARFDAVHDEDVQFNTLRVILVNVETGGCATFSA